MYSHHPVYILIGCIMFYEMLHADPQAIPLFLYFQLFLKDFLILVFDLFIISFATDIFSLIIIKYYLVFICFLFEDIMIFNSHMILHKFIKRRGNKSNTTFHMFVLWKSNLLLLVIIKMTLFINNVQMHFFYQFSYKNVTFFTWTNLIGEMQV